MYSLYICTVCVMLAVKLFEAMLFFAEQAKRRGAFYFKVNIKTKVWNMFNW